MNVRHSEGDSGDLSTTDIEMDFSIKYRPMELDPIAMDSNETVSEHTDPSDEGREEDRDLEIECDESKCECAGLSLLTSSPEKLAALIGATSPWLCTNMFIKTGLQI